MTAPVRLAGRARAGSRLLRAPVVAGGLAAVLTRLPHLWDLTVLDPDVYLTVGEQWWSNGVVPYRDLFDHKGPFLFELFAGLTAVLPDSLFALHVALLAGFLISVWQLAALGGRHGGPTTAWCTAVAYGIAGSSIVYEGPDPNADQWALVGLVASVDFADRYAAGGRARWAVAAGAALGLLVAIKLPHLAMAPLVLALLVQHPGHRRLGVLAGAAGFVGAGALTLVPFALAGALGDLRFALLDYSPGFVGDTFSDLVHDGWQRPIAWLVVFPGASLPIAGLLLAAVAWRDDSLRRLVRIGVAWLVVAWIFARSSGRDYAHYFVVLTPPLALLVGAGLDAAVRQAPALRVVVPGLVLCMLSAQLAVDGWRSALSIPAHRRWMGTDQAQLAGVDEAARLVRRITRPGERVYVVSGFGRGGQLLYWLADRRPAHRLMFPVEMVPSRIDEVAADLGEHPPAALVVIAGASIEPYRGAIASGGLVETGRFGDDPITEVRVFGKSGDRRARARRSRGR